MSLILEECRLQRFQGRQRLARHASVPGAQVGRFRLWKNSSWKGNGEWRAGSLVRDTILSDCEICRVLIVRRGRLTMISCTYCAGIDEECDEAEKESIF